MPMPNPLKTLRTRLAQPTYRSILQSMAASSAGQIALVASGICAARILGVEDRGQFAMLVLVPMILTVIGTLGVPIGITYFIARDPLNAKGVVSVTHRFVTIQAAVIMAIHIAVLIYLYHSASGPLLISAVSTVLVVPTKLAQDYGGSILQGEQRFRAFNIMRCLPPVAYAISVLTVFLLGNGDLLTVTLCYVFSTAIAGAATLAVAVVSLPTEEVQERNPHVRDIVKFSVKALFGARYPTETFQLDQAFVGFFLSRIALGTYVVGVSFTNLPRFIAQSVGMVAYPNVASISDRGQARRKAWRFFLLASVVSLAICVGLELLTPILVPFFFGDAFRGAIGVTQVLLIGSFIVSIRRVLSDGMRGAGYPTLGSLAEVAGLLILVPALMVLIPLAGITGAAMAMVVAAVGGFIVLLAGIHVTGRQEARRGAGVPSQAEAALALERTQ